MSAGRERRILLVANETVAGPELRRLIGPLEAEATVLVVAPALMRRIELWSSNDRRARREASQLLPVHSLGEAA